MFVQLVRYKTNLKIDFVIQLEFHIQSKEDEFINSNPEFHDFRFPICFIFSTSKQAQWLDNDITKF